LRLKEFRTLSVVGCLLWRGWYLSIEILRGQAQKSKAEREFCENIYARVLDKVPSSLTVCETEQYEECKERELRTSFVETCFLADKDKDGK
jgi:hypothetical protein